MGASIQLLVSTSILISISFCNGECIRRESDALIELKRGFIDESEMLVSWDTNADCCTWHEVICDNSTGHILELHLQGNGFQAALSGNISESLLELKHLRYLDLSNNNFWRIDIPEFFGYMSSLRFLNLSEASFRGAIPFSIANLTSLNTLDMSNNVLYGEIPHQLGNITNLQYLSVQASSVSLLYIDKLDWISGLSSLRFLDFSEVNLSVTPDWADSLGKLPALQQLFLSNCQLELAQMRLLSNVSFSSLSLLDLSGNENYSSSRGESSGILRSMAYLQNLTSLRRLDLSDNLSNSSIPDNWFGGFAQLEHLDLSGNKLEGRIPSSIGCLTSLITLDLSHNDLTGQIPSSIGNLTSLDTLVLSYNSFKGRVPMSFERLCNLRLLSLKSNQFSQEINELNEMLVFCSSDKLESLDLSHSQFSGYLSNVLNKFRSLVSFDVSQNSIIGPIPTSIGEMTSLISLDISSNKLNGSIPTSFGRLGNLIQINVSFNSLEGEVSESHFENLHNLLRFVATGNHLIWKVSPGWVPPFQLVSRLYLSSCYVGPQFPTWIRHLKHLMQLDLSNSNINSRLPTWVLNFSSSLYELDLSKNRMYGIIPNLPSSIEVIDLSSNHFKGPLPHMSNPIWIDLSSNMLSGSIHTLLCHERDPSILSTISLILKDNFLNGDLPIDCWMNWTSLKVLELSNNNFRGHIASSIGSLINLEMLSIRNNSLAGGIPSSLQNCTTLVALDIGENQFTGEIPSWIGTRLKNLKILNLRGNKFNGSLPKELCNLADLQILDLANNKLSGTIPICIGNLKAMSRTMPSSTGRILVYAPRVLYAGSTTIIRKGKRVEYNTTLGFVQSLDLSNNSFVGNIPAEVTNLSGLQSLNLSHNFFTGRIPKDMAAMKKLESLDLSHNHLFGEIPQSISSMNFLSYLNLSNNNLSGKIPTGTQLQTMDPSSFTGNKLCGPPLTNDCNNKEATPPSNAEGREDRGDETRLVDWFYFYVSLALGFVVGFWCFVGPLAFNIRWRNAYFNFLDILWDKFWVWYSVNIVRLVRNYGL